MVCWFWVASVFCWFISSTCLNSNKLFNTFKYPNKHNTVTTSTDHQLKENKHTSDTVIFGQMSSNKPNARKLVQLFIGLYYYAEYLSTTRCLTGSPDREKYTAAIPLYLKTGIHKTCPTKPSPAQLKLSVGPFGLCVSLLLTCVSPLTLCVSPLRHCATSGTLCVTPAASTWMTQSLWLLRCLCWALCSLDWMMISLSLLLRWSLSIVSTSYSLPLTADHWFSFP